MAANETGATEASRSEESYTAHHNWQPWITEALKGATLCTRARDLPSQQRLLARGLPLTDGRCYALFRVERRVEHDDDGSDGGAGSFVISAWATNKATEFLDPKDALFRALRDGGAEATMPATTLLPYDYELPPDASADGHYLVPSGERVILKASLGSGGSGLYFVASDAELMGVLRGHRRRAEREEGFLDGLKMAHGAVPSWSLQRLLSPVLVRFRGMLRRSQIRAYVAVVDGEVFVYGVFEVRLPVWASEEAGPPRDDGGVPTAAASSTAAIDAAALSNVAAAEANGSSGATVAPAVDPEVELCGGGGARPYNRARLKPETERLLCAECEELATDAVDRAIRECTAKAFAALKPAIRERAEAQAAQTAAAFAARAVEMGVTNAQHGARHVRVAVCGIDLMVCHDTHAEASPEPPWPQQPARLLYSGAGGGSSPGGAPGASTNHADASTGYRAYILEVNNNPAMASPAKRMSEAYRAHVVAFARSLVELCLGSGRAGGGNSNGGEAAGWIRV